MVTVLTVKHNMWPLKVFKQSFIKSCERVHQEREKENGFVVPTAPLNLMFLFQSVSVCSMSRLKEKQ